MQPERPESRSPRTLLIVGGGHATLPLIKMGKSWASEIRVVLISASRYLYYSGAIPQFMGGFYELDETRIDLKTLAGRYGTAFHEGYVTAVEPGKKQVRCTDGRMFTYDALVLNTGVETPSESSAAPLFPVKPMGRLISLQQQREAGRISRLLIAGGGAAGVELMLNISHPAQQRAAPPERLTLVHQGSRLLPGFPATIARKVEACLCARGVELRLNEAWSPGEARNKEYDAVVPATGNRPITAGIQHGLPEDASRRIRTSDFLQVEEHPEIFAAGDGARVGPGYAEVGVHAVKQGPVLRHNVATLFSGGKMKPYKPYAVSPLIISNGNSEGFFVAGKTGFTGRWAIVLKYMLDMNWLEKYTRPPQARRSWSRLLRDAQARTV